MKLNEFNFVLEEAKLLGKQNFVFHNKSKRLFVVLSMHVRRGRHNRHVRLLGFPIAAIANDLNDVSRKIGEFVIPLESFKANFTKIEDPEMMKILYEKEL